MISIRKSVTDLDHAEELQKTTAECYGLTIRSVSQYAIEVDASVTANFRKHLDALDEQWRAADSVEGLRAVQASFRGELREYRDIVQEGLLSLRREMDAAAAAMATFAANVASNGAGHEQQLKDELQHLETLAKSDNLNEIRGGIQSATTGIAVSVDQLRRSNQLVIAQLQDEIRVLHQEIQTERRTLFMDRASGVWNRHKMDIRIDELLRQGDPFCLLMVTICQLARLDHLYSRTAIEGAIKALLMRFHALLGEEAMIGRWSEQEFVAILGVEPSTAIEVASEVMRKLSGVYTVQENGIAKSVTLEISGGVVDRKSGDDRTNFQGKLKQLADALSGA